MGRGGALTLSPPLLPSADASSVAVMSRDHLTGNATVSFSHCLQLSHIVLNQNHGGQAPKKSFRVISTARVRTSPPVRLPPIYVVVCNDPQGDLILWLASCLDAFSTYPYPTRLPGRAPGGTTGVPEVGPTRSSRTSVRATQISNAHNR